MDSSMIFARQLSEEIMRQVYITQGILWQPDRGLWRLYPEFRDRVPSCGTAILATCLECIINHNKEDIAACFKELEDSRKIHPKFFCQYALQAVPVYFPDGYTHQALLSFYAMIAGVCRMAFPEYKANGILDSAADIFHMVFTAFILTKEFNLEVYDKLVEVAKKIVDKFQEHIVEVDPPTHIVGDTLLFNAL